MWDFSECVIVIVIVIVLVAPNIVFQQLFQFMLSIACTSSTPHSCQFCVNQFQKLTPFYNSIFESDYQAGFKPCKSSPQLTFLWFVFAYCSCMLCSRTLFLLVPFNATCSHGAAHVILKLILSCFLSASFCMSFSSPPLPWICCVAQLICQSYCLLDIFSSIRLYVGFCLMCNEPPSCPGLHYTQVVRETCGWHDCLFQGLPQRKHIVLVLF